ALIWLGNCLVFSLLYWELDSGGPRARYLREHEYPDFAFTQHQSPQLAPSDWRPRYVDYLVLGLTTNTATSPTDVLRMARWAKLVMALQSLISVLVVSFVFARAVNVFSSPDISDPGSPTLTALSPSTFSVNSGRQTPGCSADGGPTSPLDLGWTAQL